MPMQQIMIWGHDFLRIREGVEYLTSEPIGKIQMSIKEPKRVGNYFLVLFTNQLNSPGVSWAVIALELGRHGKPSNLAGPLSLTIRMPKGEI